MANQRSPVQMLFNWTIPAEHRDRVDRMGPYFYTSPIMIALLLTSIFQATRFRFETMNSFLIKFIWLTISSFAILLLSSLITKKLTNSTYKSSIVKTVLFGASWPLFVNILLIISWYVGNILMNPNFVNYDKNYYNIIRFFVLNLNNLKMMMIGILVSTSSSHLIYWLSLKNYMDCHQS